MPLVLLFLVLGFFGFGCVFRRSWKKDMRVAQHRNEAERSLLERNWQQDVTMLSEGRRIDGDDIEFGAKLAEGQFGEVWKGTWIALPDQWVAIKKIKFTGEEILKHQQQQQQGEQKEYLDKKDAAKKRLLTNKTASLGSRASFSRVLSKNTRGHNRGSKSESDASKFMSTVDSLFLDQQDTSWIDQEIKLLLRVKPHVRTVLFHGAGRLATGEIFLVTEFMSNGDLCSALKPCDPTTNEPLLSWEKRIQIAADIAEGMEFLHSRQPPLIHRDLKSANVLLSSNCRAKIAGESFIKFIVY
jgi:serine/threonine protein kinase